MFIAVEMKDGYGIGSTCTSSAPINNVNKENNNNRYWPADHINRYKMRNHYRQIRNTCRYKIHRHQQQFYCRQCSERNHVITSGTSHKTFQD